MGYMGAVMGLATVSGPLLGGVITDTSWLGWRWSFYVGVPFAARRPGAAAEDPAPAAAARARSYDRLPRRRAASPVASPACSSGSRWPGSSSTGRSWQTAAMVVGGLALLALAVLGREPRAAEPIIPLTLFRNRTVVLAVIASVAVGVALFGTTVFLTQYMQIGRGKSADAVRPAHHPDDGRPDRLVHRRRPAHHRAPATTSATCCSAACCCRRPRAHGHHPLRHPAGPGRRVHARARRRRRHAHAEPRAGGAERRAGPRARRCQLERRVLPHHGRRDRRQRARRACWATGSATLLPERLADAGVPAGGPRRRAGSLPDIATLPARCAPSWRAPTPTPSPRSSSSRRRSRSIALVAVVFLEEVPLSDRTAAQQLADDAAEEQERRPGRRSGPRDRRCGGTAWTRLPPGRDPRAAGPVLLRQAGPVAVPSDPPSRSSSSWWCCCGGPAPASSRWRGRCTPDLEACGVRDPAPGRHRHRDDGHAAGRAARRRQADGQPAGDGAGGARARRARRGRQPHGAAAADRRRAGPLPVRAAAPSAAVPPPARQLAGGRRRRARRPAHPLQRPGLVAGSGDVEGALHLQVHVVADVHLPAEERAARRRLRADLEGAALAYTSRPSVLAVPNEAACWLVPGLSVPVTCTTRSVAGRGAAARTTAPLPLSSRPATRTVAAPVASSRILDPRSTARETCTSLRSASGSRRS